MPHNPYEGVEHPENFADRAAVDLYRRVALDKSRAQADFVTRNFPQARTLLEACCGNGRLLVSLADRLDHVYGFDLAESRVAFGSCWIAERTIANASIWRDDAMAPSERLSGLRVELGLCLTGAFGYFEALRDGAGQRIIERLAGNIEPSGGLILELLQHPRDAAACRQDPDRRHRSWIELPESDPFRFYLSEFEFDESRQVLAHRKIFVGRDGRIDTGRSEALRLYRRDEVAALLAPWFEDLSFYSDWAESPYSEGSDTLIVKATRKRLGHRSSK